jgi:hypothetical protein
MTFLVEDHGIVASTPENARFFSPQENPIDPDRLAPYPIGIGPSLQDRTRSVETAIQNRGPLAIRNAEAPARNAAG